MVRLTVISQSREETVLKVEGWIHRADLAWLEQDVKRWLREAQRVVLDLDDVKLIAPAGIEALKRCAGDRLVLRGGSVFLRTLLSACGLILENACSDA